MDDGVREHVARNYPRLGLERCSVSLGFGGVEGSLAISPLLLDKLEDEGFRDESIWRGVVLGAVGPQAALHDLPVRWTGPDGLISWVAADPERTLNSLRAADNQLSRQGRKQVIVFDALDRAGSRWPSIQRRTQSLLRLALSLRAYRSIKAKIFLRTDQAQDRSVTAFPDASKLITSAVELDWGIHDLYGLLFHRLANDDAAGHAFSELLQDLGVPMLVGMAHPIELTQDLKESEESQERVFVALAGRYTGSDKRKGRTYKWLHNHLADARGQVSPRSFLEAVRAAADSGPPGDTPLTPKGLQKGLQAASRVRVEQLKEEYGWIESVLAPLADQSVPCPDQALYSRWSEATTLESIDRGAESDHYLVPIEFESEGARHDSLLRALMRIGITERRPDGRINVPDIYRVAAKLLKRGGVPPER
ncbi:MAG: hypothetical protein AB1758_24280 [Candidatus Eremiobacterota bacterium]